MCVVRHRFQNDGPGVHQGDASLGQAADGRDRRQNIAIAVAGAMTSEAPLLPLPTNDGPAIPATAIAASPAEVSTIAGLARMARTTAPIAAPRSTIATMACVASAAEPKPAERKDPLPGPGACGQRPPEEEHDDGKHAVGSGAGAHSGGRAVGVTIRRICPRLPRA